MKTNLWQKGSIFGTFVGCCLIMALLCSSMATDYWVAATAKDGSSEVGSVNFGLVKGQKTLTKKLSKRVFDIKVVCLSGECMYSCGINASERLKDITDLVNNTNPPKWNESSACHGSTVKAVRPAGGPAGPPGGPPAGSPLGLLVRARTLRLSLFPAVKAAHSVTEVFKTEPDFMSRGLWIATLVMMGFAILMVLVAAMFAILNTATNPVETITGVAGLYLWNGVAMLFELLALVLWGVQFHQHLSHSVLWREERLQNWSTEGLANLGYSYWLVFVAFILHIVNMAVLWFGTHQKRPKKVQIPVERGNANATNMIY